MHPELERLIDLALANGKITDKELEVLYRKAKELAVNMDEFEMVLETKHQQIARISLPRKAPHKEGTLKSQMATNDRPTSALFRFGSTIASFALFMVGVPTFVEACDRSNHDEPYAWLLFLVSIAALLLAYRIYRPVRTEIKRKKEAEEAAMFKLERQYPEFAEMRERDRRTKDLARAIVEELKNP